MPRKVNLSQARKNEIKKDFSSLTKSSLSGEEKRYYTLIQNGKNSAKNNVRFEGKYLGGEIVETMRHAARLTHTTLEDYLESHKKYVRNYIERGAITVSKNPDKIIDIINSSKRKTVEIDDGNGFVRMRNQDAIKELTALLQFAASTTTIVELGIKIKIYPDKKIKFSIPTKNIYRDLTQDEFTELLDEFDIDYFESDKTKKKKK